MKASSSRKEKYNAGYGEWLKFCSLHMILAPFRSWKGILKYFGLIFMGIFNTVVWLLVICTFPISFPALAWWNMFTGKRRMRNQYGHERLSS